MGHITQGSYNQSEEKVSSAHYDLEEKPLAGLPKIERRRHRKSHGKVVDASNELFKTFIQQWVSSIPGDDGAK